MKRSRRTNEHEDFGGAIREFGRWRATRPRGARIPAALWRSAASLAAVHGVNRTATALGLDYYALKRQLDGQSSSAAASTNSATSGADAKVEFLEVSLPSSTSAFACAIEVEHSEGGAVRSKLRLDLKSVAVSDLDIVLRTVWSERK